MKPKVVILSAFLSPFRSGAEACVEEVPPILSDRYDFAIVTARLRKDLPKEDEINGIPVVRVGFGTSFDKWLYPFLAPFAAKKLEPTIIHGVLETFAGLALLFCSFIVPGKKRVLTMQTTNRDFLKKPIVKSPDVVTAISKELISQAKLYGRKDTVHIPNGVHLKDVPRHKPVPGRLLFVGRLEPMKGVDTLLQALKAIVENNPDSNVHLHIVGDGGQRKNLEELSQALEIADRVTFVGKLSSTEVLDEYAHAEIFCGLSRSEAFGNVFLEAQACACAVVGTRIGGIPDIIHDGKSGILVMPEDSVMAAHEITKLLDDEILRTAIVHHGVANSVQYDWSKIAERYAKVYDSLVA